MELRSPTLGTQEVPWLDYFSKSYFSIIVKALMLLTMGHFPEVLQSLSDSVQFGRSVLSDSLQPHELQHARPPCPSPIPRVHSDSRPSSQRCHPAISSSVIPFSSCPQSLPASRVFSNESTLRMRWPNYVDYRL